MQSNAEARTGISSACVKSSTKTRRFRAFENGFQSDSAALFLLSATGWIGIHRGERLLCALPLQR